QKRNLRRKHPKAATNPQKPSQQKLLLPARRRQPRRNHRKNPPDVLATATRTCSNAKLIRERLDRVCLTLWQFLQLRDERLRATGEVTIELPHLLAVAVQ